METERIMDLARKWLNVQGFTDSAILRDDPKVKEYREVVDYLSRADVLSKNGRYQVTYYERGQKPCRLSLDRKTLGFKSRRDLEVFTTALAGRDPSKAQNTRVVDTRRQFKVKFQRP